MKTPEEIKKGIECCTKENRRCLECPYPIGYMCAAELMKDALAYIQQLEDAIDKTTQLIKSGTEIIKKNNERIESTYGQVRKALCGKENATMVEFLQAVDQLKDRLAQAERERDAAVKDCSRFPCATCSGKENGNLCRKCNVRKDTTRTNYEWRGVCPENSKEGTNEN